jgi:phosphate acetyltransferase
MNNTTVQGIAARRNLTFDEITVGQPLTLQRSLNQSDIDLLSFAAGVVDTFALDDEGPNGHRPDTVQAISAATLIMHLVHRRLPGAGCEIVEESFEFAGSLAVGETITATVTPIAKDAARQAVTLDCRIDDNTGETILKGRVVAIAPTRHIERTETAPSEVIFRRTDALGHLIRRAQGQGEPVRTAVVHPCDHDSLLGPVEAARRGLIEPVLVGPEAKIRATAQAAGVDLAPFRIVAVEHSHEAAMRAVAMARAGEVAALMKGSLHTDELMSEVVARDGLRTARRVTHAFLMDVPAYPRLLLVTDAAVNIAPDIRTKADILQNAFDLARVLGIEQPKAAVLAAVETVNPDMTATVDAAMLCKMVDRGQITGGLVDGPLAFDNAVSEEAARIKKIDSPVAGRADILLVPDLEAGNMVAKQLQYLAGADSAGIVLGARVPIVLTSRADSVRTRLASVAVMKLLAEDQRRVAAAKVQGL